MKKILSAFAVFSALITLPYCRPPTSAQDIQNQVIGPFGGLNNSDSPLIIPSDRAQDLLNVDITPGGKSFKKRKGYATAYTLAITTSPVHGVYNFYDSNGNFVALFFNDSRMSASVGGASPSVLFTTGTFGATYQCTDSAGFAYCVNTSRDSMIKTSGSTYTIVGGSLGTMITVTPERLVVAGVSGAANRIDFSKANDFTTWTVGGQPTDPVQFTITAPGARITHITYAFNRVMWFKDSSFGYILSGPTLGDWVVKTVDPNLGTLDNTSVYHEGILYFRGQDGHIYVYDGSQIEKITGDLQETISASQSRTSNSWTQTSQSDWQASSITADGYLSTTITAGSVVLATAAAVSSFIDTSQSDFEAGTLTNLDATTTPGSLSLTLSSEFTINQNYPADVGGINVCSGSGSQDYFGQIFYATTSYSATSVVLRLSKLGSPPNATVSINSGSASSIGSVLASATLSPASVSAIPTYSDVTISIGPQVLTAGSSYWILIKSDVGCDNLAFSEDYILWNRESGSFPTGSNVVDGTFNATSRNKYKINGKQYPTTGNIVSQAFDVGFDTSTWLWPWSTFTANSTLNSQTLTYETQTASSTSGTWSSLASVTSGSTPSSAVNRFIRYKASFGSSQAQTPVLTDVTISMGSRKRPTGTLSSQVNNSPNIRDWDSFTATKQDNDGSHAFYIRAATGAFTISSSTPSWTAISPGAIPSVSTGVYIQVRDVFTITNSTQNPKLDDFTVNWFEGSASDKSYAAYHDDAIWWALASGAGATANNKVIRHDLLNNFQTLYDIASNGFFIKSQSLYFGGVSAGTIFKFGDVDNDNGSAIEAYWKSKDFFADSPFTEKELATLSFAAGSVANSSVTVTYAVNASSEVPYTAALYTANNGFTRNNKNLPTGRTGTTFNVKIGNDAADQPFEVFGIQVGYRPRAWRPFP